MVAILTDFESPRLTYVCETIFDEWLGRPFTIIRDPSHVPEGATVVTYGVDHPTAKVSIPNEGLLRENNIRRELPRILGQEDGSKVLFSEDKGFDLFSAVFFCLTRYEEYIQTKRDKHGRFEAKDSVFRDYLTVPYLDRWILELEKNLFGSVKKRKFLWINTMDVDIAFAYKGRSLQRLLGATIKDFVRGRWDRLSERNKTLTGSQKDPFDTYEAFHAGQAETNLVFYQAGGKSKFDLSLGAKHQEIGKLFSQLHSNFVIGLHPSYASKDSLQTIEREKGKLESLLGQEVIHSRQHFLRMSLPATYRYLAEAGINYDYSMGFHDAVGFRAGTAYPFRFFDLHANEALKIRLQPSIVMDSALNHYMNMTTEDAKKSLSEVIESMKMTGGFFTSIWHNHSLSEREEWEGWSDVFKSMAQNLSNCR